MQMAILNVKDKLLDFKRTFFELVGGLLKKSPFLCLWTSEEEKRKKLLDVSGNTSSSFLVLYYLPEKKNGSKVRLF